MTIVDGLSRFAILYIRESNVACLCAVKQEGNVQNPHATSWLTGKSRSPPMHQDSICVSYVVGASIHQHKGANGVNETRRTAGHDARGDRGATALRNTGGKAHRDSPAVYPMCQSIPLRILSTGSRRPAAEAPVRGLLRLDQPGPDRARPGWAVARSGSRTGGCLCGGCGVAAPRPGRHREERRSHGHNRADPRPGG
jgi:hypothetical protein